jgi:hypothetical protein
VTLLVLSVLAIAAIRDRTELAKAAGQISTLEQDVAALLSGEPYYVLDYTSALEVREGGADAVTTRTKKIRFDQNSVLSISDLSQSTGEAVSYDVSPRPLERVSQFMTGGQKHSLISLGRPWNRGEQLEFTIQEGLANAFLGDREDLTVDIKNPTDRLVMTVAWSGERAVEKIFVERYGKLVSVDVSELKIAPDGRRWYAHVIDQPQLGETISVIWDWGEPAAEAQR